MNYLFLLNKLVLCFIIPLYLASCSKQNRSSVSDQVETIFLEEEIISDGNVHLLSEIAKSSYFFKPSSKDALIGKIIKVERKDSNYFIQDNTNKIFIFKSTGEFNGMVGEKGRGPNEYIEIADFAINPGKNELVILDGAVRKIVFYDLNGKFLRSIKTYHIESQIRYIDSTHLITYTNRVIESLNNHNLINIIDLNGKTINSFYNVKDEKIPLHSPVLTFEVIKNYFDTISYYDNINNIFFHLNEGRLNSVIRFDLGKYSMPRKFLLPEKFPTPEEFNEMSSFFSPHWFLETKRSLFIKALFQKRLKLINIDKNTHKTTTIRIPWGQREQGYLNDLSGGGIFWPSGSFRDGDLYSIIDPFELINILKYPIFIGYGIKTENLERELGTINETSNPWILIVKLQE